MVKLLLKAKNLKIKKFVITGTFDGMTREEIKRIYRITWWLNKRISK
ncbi:MAG: hypothetical protein L6V81_09880 [Clostridium sp.]|nr:MAG: hypothetical protein L6V81_09880 [Clostridium sp.]